MGFGKAVKNLFWQSDEEAFVDADGPTEDAELSPEEFAALLATSPHAVPEDALDPVDVASINVIPTDEGAVKIDFQAQYNAANIPDTDEVEQLENFLERLDPQLPRSSKIAAAQAFLGAIGKDKQAVLQDAERKIRRVHGVLEAKQQSAKQASMAEQSSIDDLQAQIDRGRERLQALTHELEGVRRACLIEESRLQAARVFFGEVKPATGG